jgi:hypothetical protein
VVTLTNGSVESAGAVVVTPCVLCVEYNLCLSFHGPQVSADYYHAGMTKAQKSSVQAGWLQGHIKIVCATIAYGVCHRLIATVNQTTPSYPIPACLVSMLVQTTLK